MLYMFFYTYIRDNEKTTCYSHILKILSIKFFRYPRVRTYILVVPYIHAYLYSRNHVYLTIEIKTLMNFFETPYRNSISYYLK